VDEAQGARSQGSVWEPASDRDGKVTFRRPAGIEGKDGTRLQNENRQRMDRKLAGVGLAAWASCSLCFLLCPELRAERALSSSFTLIPGLVQCSAQDEVRFGIIGRECNCFAQRFDR
jgi:hypothetical protein